MAIVIRRESFGGLIADPHSYNTRILNHSAFEALRVANRVDSIPSELRSHLTKLGFDLWNQGFRVVDQIDHSCMGTVLSAPLIFWFELTDLCPLRCQHCFLPPAEREPVALEIDAVECLLQELHTLGVPRITLTGGEALVYPYIDRVVQLAHDLGFGLRLFTSGCLGPWHRSRLCTFPLDWIFISIDGGERSHDELRGKGSYAEVVQCLRELVATGHISRTTISTTLDRVNLREMPGVFELASELGVRAILLRILMHYDWSRQSPLRKFTSKQEVFEAVNYLMDLSVKWNVEVQLNKLPFFPVSKTVFMDDSPLNASLGAVIGREPTGDCVGGNLVCGVRADGTVIPCGFIPFAYDTGENNSIYNRSFAWLWHNSKNLRMLRQLKLPVACASCPKHSVCTGGCRANPIVFGVDVNSLDPYCLYHETLLGEPVVQVGDLSRYSAKQKHLSPTEHWFKSMTPMVSEELIVSKCGWIGDGYA